MVRSFYPWVENPSGNPSERSTESPSDEPNAFEGRASSEERAELERGFATHEARIAVVDDPSVAPRVSIVDPAPIRDYVEAITQTTYASARDQGGSLPFMVIREVVENLIHAYFTDPVVTILPGGNTIRFSDRGPGIASKERAMEYGTTTATEEMKRYIRGVGSGLPYVLHFLNEKGGSLTIEDNLSTGTVVTMSLEPQVSRETRGATLPMPGGNPRDPSSGVDDILGAALAEREVADEDASLLSSDLALTPADHQILSYLRTHPNVGPKDLTDAYGASLSTWSRRLSGLESKGLLEKRGQKRYPTARGLRLAQLLAPAV